MNTLQIIPLDGRYGPFETEEYPFPPPPPPFPEPLPEPISGWEIVEIGVGVVIYVAVFIYIVWLFAALFGLLGDVGGGGVTYIGLGGGHHHHGYGGYRPVVAGRPHIHSGGGHSHSTSHSHSSSGSHSHYGRSQREARNSWIDEPGTLHLLSKILSPLEEYFHE